MKEKLLVRMCVTNSCDTILYSSKNSIQCPGCSSFGVRVKKVSLKVSL